VQAVSPQAPTQPGFSEGARAPPQDGAWGRKNQKIFEI